MFGKGNPALAMSKALHIVFLGVSDPGDPQLGNPQRGGSATWTSATCGCPWEPWTSATWTSATCGSVDVRFISCCAACYILETLTKQPRNLPQTPNKSFKKCTNRLINGINRLVNSWHESVICSVHRLLLALIS